MVLVEWRRERVEARPTDSGDHRRLAGHIGFGRGRAVGLRPGDRTAFARHPGGGRGVPLQAARRRARPGCAGRAQPASGGDDGGRRLRRRHRDPRLAGAAAVKGARVALSVLAVPLFVTGLVSGGIGSAVVTAAIVMLWFQPARDWFDGITRAPAPKPLASPTPPRPGGTRCSTSRPRLRRRCIRRRTPPRRRRPARPTPGRLRHVGVRADLAVLDGGVRSARR